MSMDKPPLSTAGHTNRDVIYMRALSLIDQAAACGLVLTITTKPREPLAMGNYDMDVDVRPNHNSYRGGA